LAYGFPIGSKQIAAAGTERKGVKIAVRVEVFEVHELVLVMNEMRPGVPGRDVQPDGAVAGWAASSR